MTLTGTDLIKFRDTHLRFEFQGMPSGTNPVLYIKHANQIQWDYTLNTSVQPTYGGEVVQILSCYAGPITISGQVQDFFKTPGDPDSFVAGGTVLKNIYDWFRTYMAQASGQGHDTLRDQVTMRFTYPERGWDLYIQPTAINGFAYGTTRLAQEWSITAEVMTDNDLNMFSAATMASFSDTSGVPAYMHSSFQYIQGDFTYVNAAGQTMTLGIAGGGTGDPRVDPQAAGNQQQSISSDPMMSLISQLYAGDFSLLSSGGAEPLTVTGADNATIGSLQDYEAAFAGGSVTPPLPTYPGVTNSQQVTTGTTVYTAQSTLAAGANAQWISDVITGLEATITVQNQNFMYSWWTAEGLTSDGTAANNWLNIGPGATYISETAGVAAVTSALTQGYPHIVDGLTAGNPYSQSEVAQDLSNWDVGPNGNQTVGAKYANSILGRYSTSTSPQGGTTTGATGGVGAAFVYYSQADPTWAGDQYGQAGTIQTGGCGITSSAMVISSLSGQIVNPEQAATQFAAYGSPQGSDFSLYSAIASAYNLKYAALGTDMTTVPTVLQNGGLVIACGTSPSNNQNPWTNEGHVVVIRAMSGTGVLLGDPNAGPPFSLANPKNTEVYSLDSTSTNNIGSGLQELYSFYSPS